MKPWRRLSDYAGQSGEWTITELISKGVSAFLLYRGEKIVGKFASKDEAKAEADRLYARSLAEEYAEQA